MLPPSTLSMDCGAKAQLYARHRVPYDWIVDHRPRTIDGYALVGGAYRPVARLEGTDPIALPPFPELALDPATIWT